MGNNNSIQKSIQKSNVTANELKNAVRDYIKYTKNLIFLYRPTFINDEDRDDKKHIYLNNIQDNKNIGSFTITANVKLFKNVISDLRTKYEIFSSENITISLKMHDNGRTHRSCRVIIDFKDGKTQNIEFIPFYRPRGYNDTMNIREIFVLLTITYDSSKYEFNIYRNDDPVVKTFRHQYNFSTNDINIKSPNAQVQLNDSKKLELEDNGLNIGDFRIYNTVLSLDNRIKDIYKYLTNKYNTGSSYFYYYRLTQYRDYIGDWNVSQVTDMSYMFKDATSFNQDISNWDVSNVTNMNGMFDGATSFNQNLSIWNDQLTSEARDSINRTWATRKNLIEPKSEPITDNNLLKELVNKYLDSDDKVNFSHNNKFYGRIGTWDVSNITYMNGLFKNKTNFNEYIRDWDVSKVRGMEEMFQGATNFNQDISGWNVGKVEDMSYMFDGATSFNQDLSKWNDQLTSDARDSINENWDTRSKNLLELYTNERYSIPTDSYQYSIPTNTNKIMSSRAKIVYNF